MTDLKNLNYFLNYFNVRTLKELMTHSPSHCGNTQFKDSFSTYSFCLLTELELWNLYSIPTSYSHPLFRLVT